MTPTPEALTDAARVLRDCAFWRASDAKFLFETTEGRRADLVRKAESDAANLSTVAAWLEKQGWRRIAEAPRQTIVMLYWPYWSHLPCFGCWQPHPTETRLRWISDVVLGGDGPGPTHWMPLPEAPTPPESQQ